MYFQLLGPLEVSDRGRSVVVGGGKRRSLLALLLLHANEVVASERLIDELWGERPPATSGTIVRVYVSQLRRELPGDGLLTRAGGYVLRVGPDDLDVLRFERVLAQGMDARLAGEPARAAQLLRGGLALWRGPPLADFSYEPFAQREIARLEELRLVALEERIDADLALGRHAQLVGDLAGLTRDHPLRERMRGQLMLALYRCGRQAEALSVQIIDVPSSPAAIVIGRGGVWVASSGDDSVSRIDPGSGKVLATIGVGDQPVGLAVDDRGLWVANAASGTVTRVDPAGGRVVQSIDVGNGAQGIAAGPGGVWVANRLDGTVSRIDPDTNAVVQTIPVGRAPSGIALVAGSVWVSDESEGSVTRIARRSGDLTTFPLGSQAGNVALGDGALLVSVRGAERAHRGGTLTAVAPDVLDSIDPAVAYFSVSWSILALTNDGLVGFKRVGGLDGATLVPDLARSIPRPTDGGRTYTFALRPGIRYSDGSRVRPQDFRRAIERIFTLESSGRPYYRAIVGTAACHARSCDLSQGIVADEKAGTVTYHLSKADPEFLLRLALPFAFAVPAGTPDRPAETTPLPATGPYAIESYTKSQELVLHRNPRFNEWSRAAQPAGFPDRIAWRLGGDEGRHVTDVLEGRADLMFFPPPHDRLAELEASHAGQLHITPRPGNYYMALGTATTPFDDVRVRRALNLALDRAAIGRLFGKTGQSTCQILPPNFPGYVPYCPYDGPDLARARKLVAASGNAGARVTVWATPDYAFGMPVPVGRYFVGLLRNLGYRARLREVSGQEEYFTAVVDPSRRVQIAFAGWATDYPAESGFIVPSLSCTADTRALFCDRRVDRRMAAATRLALTDPVAAHRRWSSIEHDLVDRAPWVPLVSRLWVNLVSERVGDFQVHPQVGPLVDQMWVR